MKDFFFICLFLFLLALAACVMFITEMFTDSIGAEVFHSDTHVTAKEDLHSENN